MAKRNFRKQLKTNIMENSQLHNLINLRAMMIDSETQRNYRVYGKDSATAKGKYFKENIGLFVSYILKPVILSNK
jgi:hypothetical protein